MTESEGAMASYNWVTTVPEKFCRRGVPVGSLLVDDVPAIVAVEIEGILYIFRPKVREYGSPVDEVGRYTELWYGTIMSNRDRFSHNFSFSEDEIVEILDSFKRFTEKYL